MQTVCNYLAWSQPRSFLFCFVLFSAVYFRHGMHYSVTSREWDEAVGEQHIPGGTSHTCHSWLRCCAGAQQCQGPPGPTGVAWRPGPKATGHHTVSSSMCATANTVETSIRPRILEIPVGRGDFIMTKWLWRRTEGNRASHHMLRHWTAVSEDLAPAAEVHSWRPAPACICRRSCNTRIRIKI